MSDRRSFLRGLASLPLIGGSVALVGRPTAAAVPITDALQDRYLAWLAHEHRAAVREHAFRKAVAIWRPSPASYDQSAVDYATRTLREGNGQYLSWMPEAPDVERLVEQAPTATRAAIVLSAVGCPMSGQVL